MKKNRLNEIVEELQGASKMHLKQSKEIKKHIDDMGSPAKVVGGTKKDSTFIKQFHPTFTKGYFNKSLKDFKNSEENSEVYRSLDKPTRRSWNETTIQANKFDEKKAIKLAKDKKIDTELWNAQNKGIPL